MRAGLGVRLAMWAVGTSVLLLVFMVGPVRAQAGASTGLMARVTDSTGAAVPGVTVTITHVETARQRSIVTNSTGDVTSAPRTSARSRGRAAARA